MAGDRINRSPLVLLSLGLTLLLALVAGWWLGETEVSGDLPGIRAATRGGGLAGQEPAALVLPAVSETEAGAPARATRTALPDASVGPALPPAPAAGLARMTVRVKAGRKGVSGRRVAIAKGGEAVCAPVSAVTSRGGRAVFDVAPLESVEVLVFGRAGKEQPTGGSPIKVAFVTPKAGQRKTVVVDLLQFDDSESLRFQVVSYPWRAPIEGAKIKATRLPGAGSPTASTHWRSKTDAEGRGSCPFEEQLEIKISAPGHASVTLNGLGRGSELRQVELAANATLFGRLALPDDWDEGQTRRLQVYARQPVPRGIPMGRFPQLGDTAPYLRPVPLAADGSWSIGSIPFEDQSSTHHPLEIIVTGAGIQRLVGVSPILFPGDVREIPDVFSDAVRQEVSFVYDRGLGAVREMTVILVGPDSGGSRCRLRARIRDDGTLDSGPLPLGTWDVLLQTGSTSVSVGPDSELILDAEDQGRAPRIASFLHRGSDPLTVVMEGFVPLRCKLPEPEGGESHHRTLAAEFQGAAGSWTVRENPGTRHTVDFSPAPLGETVTITRTVGRRPRRRYVSGAAVQLSHGEVDKQSTDADSIQVVVTGGEIVLDF